MGLAKGQGQLPIVIMALSLGVAFSQVPEFTTRYVVSNSFNEMEKNHLRYESMAYSYIYTNQDGDSKLEFSDEQLIISSATGSGDQCSIDPAFYPPREFNVTFSHGTKFYSNLGCASSLEYVAGDYDMQYPIVSFYGVENGEIGGINAVVNN